MKGNVTSEKWLERQFCTAVRVAGGIPVKLTDMTRSGLPDRLALLPGGRVMLAEIKSKGERPRPLQEYMITKIREMGFKVYVIDSYEALREVTKSI